MVTVALDLPCLTPAVAVEFLGSQVPVYKDDVLLSKGFSSHLADCSKESSWSKQNQIKTQLSKRNRPCIREHSVKSGGLPKDHFLAAESWSSHLNYLRLSLFLCKTDMTTGLPGQITETTRWGQQTNLSALHVGCPECQCMAAGR